MEFIKEGQKFSDAKVKNKWRFEWLKEKDGNGTIFSEWCKKIKEEGHCFCFVCSKKINYGSNGKKALKKHAEDKVHQTNLRGLKCSISFPGSCQVSKDVPLSFNDRKANQKAVLSCFLAENSLPFSLAPKLVELGKTLAKDKAALGKLKMERTAATYITTHGVAKTMREELVAKLSKNPFSMNVDEATNNNSDKILNVLVRVYDDEQHKVITAHLGSKKENIATSQNIFFNIKDLLESNKINPSQIVSCLLDNCATMRGCRNGVEKLLRDLNKNLLDIDGDMAHKFSNTAKLFFGNFGRFIEDLAINIFQDINESPKATELFTNIQQLLSFPKLKPLRPIENRFLQMHVICERIFSLKDTLLLYYKSFLTKEEREKYNYLFVELSNKHQISDEIKKSLYDLQKNISKQKRSDVNMSRKDSIISTLFFQYEKFHILLAFYRELLPFFNTKVKFFQTEKPIMHQVHAELFDFFKTFLSYFLKPGFIPESITELKDFTVVEENILSDKYLNVGKTAYSLLKKASGKKCKWVDQFFISLRKAYVQTTSYIVKNFPFNNKCLLYFSALNPKFRQESSCLSALTSLGEMLPNVIPEEDMGSFLQEVKNYIMDENVNLIDVNGWEKEGGRIDVDWWSHIFRMQENGSPKYTLLTQMVKAVLSVFSGPLVEGTFNIMDDIITDDRSTLTLENYEASSLIKYYLRSQGKQSSTFIPTHKMRRNIFSARREYQENLDKKKGKVPQATVPELGKNNAGEISKVLSKRKALSPLQQVSKKTCTVPAVQNSIIDGKAPSPTQEVTSAVDNSNEGKTPTPVQKKTSSKSKESLKTTKITNFFTKK